MIVSTSPFLFVVHYPDVPDENECVGSTHTCDATTICNNTVGSYRCICMSGYTENGASCIREYLTEHVLSGKSTFNMFN